MAANYTANLKNTMPKINFPKFPKFPNGGGSWQLAPEGAGSIAVAVEGAGVAEGVIGLGNGGFSGFPDMGSLGLGLKMMEDINNSNNIINNPEAKILVTGDEWEEYFKVIYGEENIIRNIPKRSSDNLNILKHYMILKLFLLIQ